MPIRGPTAELPGFKTWKGQIFQNMIKIYYLFKIQKEDKMAISFLVDSFKKAKIDLFAKWQPWPKDYIKL